VAVISPGASSAGGEELSVSRINCSAVNGGFAAITMSGVDFLCLSGTSIAGAPRRLGELSEFGTHITALTPISSVVTLHC
jgi:hypothetical protein